MANKAAHIGGSRSRTDCTSGECVFKGAGGAGGVRGGGGGDWVVAVITNKTTDMAACTVDSHAAGGIAVGEGEVFT